MGDHQPQQGPPATSQSPSPVPPTSSLLVSLGSFSPVALGPLISKTDYSLTFPGTQWSPFPHLTEFPPKPVL